jgi:hypothetical protein
MFHCGVEFGRQPDNRLSRLRSMDAELLEAFAVVAPPRNAHGIDSRASRRAARLYRGRLSEAPRREIRYDDAED